MLRVVLCLLSVSFHTSAMTHKPYLEQKELLKDAWKEENNVCRAFSVGNYEEGARVSQRSLDAIREVIRITTKKSARVCLYRTLCYEHLEGPEIGYNAAFSHYLGIMADVLNEDELGGLPDRYLHRYATQPRLDHTNRGILKGLIRNLQGILDTADVTQPSKKRRVTPSEPEELSTLVGSPQRPDPLSYGLPNELVSHIFRYFGTAELAKASRVSKQWYKCVMTLSTLLTEPRFADAPAVSDMVNYLRTCERQNVKSAKAICLPLLCYDQQNDLMKQISDSKFQIQELEMEFGNNFSWTADVDGSNLIGHSFRGLRSLRLYVKSGSGSLGRLLKGLPSLKSLFIHFIFSHSADISFEPAVVPNLKKLHISATSVDGGEEAYAEDFVERSVFVNAERLELIYVPVNMKTLVKYLRISRPKQLVLHSIYDIDLYTMATACKTLSLKLSSLDVRYVTEDTERFTESEVAALLSSVFSKLQWLNLQDAELSAGFAMTLLKSTRCSLKHLEMDADLLDRVCKDFSLGIVLEKCPLLEYLGVHGLRSYFGICDRFMDSLSSLHRFRTLKLAGFDVSSLIKYLFPLGSPTRHFNVDISQYNAVEDGIVRYIQTGGFCSRIRCIEEDSGTVYKSVRVL